MKKKDIEELFDNISVGTVIKIMENSNEPNEIEPLFAIRKQVDAFSQFETEFKLIVSHTQIRLY